MVEDHSIDEIELVCDINMCPAAAQKSVILGSSFLLEGSNGFDTRKHGTQNELAVETLSFKLGLDLIY